MVCHIYTMGDIPTNTNKRTTLTWLNTSQPLPTTHINLKRVTMVRAEIKRVGKGIKVIAISDKADSAIRAVKPVVVSEESYANAPTSESGLAKWALHLLGFVIERG